jgi:hypothetical protein
MFALKSPVLKPMTICAKRIIPRAVWDFSMMPGTVETMRMMCPMSAMKTVTMIVLYRPRCAAAMYALMRA